MGNELRAVSRVWFNVGSHGSGDEWETGKKDIPAPGTSCKERRSRALRSGPPKEEQEIVGRDGGAVALFLRKMHTCKQIMSR